MRGARLLRLGQLGFDVGDEGADFAKRGKGPAHGFFVGQDHDFAELPLDIAFEVGDQGDQADAIQGRLAADQVGFVCCLGQFRLAELSGKQLEASVNKSSSLGVHVR